jgi:hypothetical protein
MWGTSSPEDKLAGDLCNVIGGSSARAGFETARHLLGRISISLPEEEIGDEGLPTDDAPPDPQEVELLFER